MRLEGICAGCQSKHSVRVLSVKLHEDTDWLDYDMAHEAEDNCVMVSHNVPGTGIPCEGSGTTPQALVD